MKRREFIKKIAATVSVVPVLSALTQTVIADEAIQNSSDNWVPTDLVIDRRYVRDIDQIRNDWLTAEDIHWLDYGVSGELINKLNPIWNEGERVIAGLTLSAELFVLKTVAEDKGYQLLSTEDHGDLVAWEMAPKQMDIRG